MLELLYACGLRVTELVSVTTHDINLRQGVVRITGKGRTERLVPFDRGVRGAAIAVHPCQRAGLQPVPAH